eukprot:4062923-Pyramimonas_sp.AAC.1
MAAALKMQPTPTEPVGVGPSQSAQVKQLVDAFGTKRLMWGSDFPFVVEECGYAVACLECERPPFFQNKNLK